MDSYINDKLKSSSINIVNRIHKVYPVSTTNFITYSLLLNAFALLALINGSFILFIMLFATSFYIQFLGKINKRLKNDITRISKIYGRLSVWIMFGSTLYFIINIYDNEITFPISLIFTIILGLCNINYSLKILNKIENKEFDHNEDINSYFIEKWANMFKGIPKRKRDNISKITKWFDEIMVVVYFIIIVIYLNYKKQ